LKSKGWLSNFVRSWGGLGIITLILEQWYKWEIHHFFTQNYKILGLWILSLIKCSTFTLPSHIRHIVHTWYTNKFTYGNWIPYYNAHKIWSPKPRNCDIMFVSGLIHHDIWCWNAHLINKIFSLLRPNKFFNCQFLSLNYKKSMCGLLHNFLFFYVKIVYIVS